MTSGNKMRKEVMSSSLKVSRTIEKKPQFSNLINVLKPKVYITDSSRFMMLVQELTGNGTSSSFSSCTTTTTTTTTSSSSPRGNGSSSNPVFEPVVTPVIHVMEQDSFSTNDLLSFDSLQQYYLDKHTYSDTLEKSSNPTWDTDLSFRETSEAENLFYENQLPVMDNEWSVYQDLESWLLETDQQPFQYQNCSYGIDSIGDHEQGVAAFNLEDICSWLL